MTVLLIQGNDDKGHMSSFDHGSYYMGVNSKGLTIETRILERGPTSAWDSIWV